LSRRIALATTIAALFCVGAAGSARQPAGGTARLLARVTAAPPDARETLLERAIRDAGGTPLVDDESALFLVRADGSRAPRIVGDFNDWPDTSTDGGDAGAMEPLESTRWFFLRVPLPRSARIEYLVHRTADGPALDPLNPRSVPGFTGRYSELRMPGYVEPAAFAGQARPLAGRLDTHTLRSEAFGDDRTVHVYTPGGDGRSREALPLVVFGDGATWIDLGGAPAVIDHEIAAGRIRPLVAAFVPTVDRATEYRGQNPRQRRLIVDEVVPFVERRYPSGGRREARAIVGSSRGALMALDVALGRPEAFGFCGAISPATQPVDVASLLDALPRRDFTFYILGTSFDHRWIGDAHRLHALLRDRGIRSTLLEVPEGHNYGAWRGGLGALLQAFVPAAAAPGHR
jgi:enterochelin esterase family protein